MSVACAHLEPICVRPAREEDAAAIRDLILIAGDEPPDFPFDPSRHQGALIHLERRRAARRHQHFAIRHALLAALGGSVCGLMLGYRIARHLEVIGSGALPPCLRPVHHVSAIGRASFYINTLACYPDFQNQGIGGRLLAAAETLAIRSKCRSLALEVSATNTGARIFYERRGFVVKVLDACPQNATNSGPCLLMTRHVEHSDARPFACARQQTSPAPGLGLFAVPAL